MDVKTLISPENTWALMAILVGWAAISIWLEQTYEWASKVTGAIIGLIGAMLLANFKVIPTDAQAYDLVWGYVVPLAIPLLLFNANVKKIWKESGRLIFMFLLSALGTMLGSFVAFVLLKNKIPNLYKMAGMMTGSYIGGGVNFVAMADTFDLTGDWISALVVADNLNMAIYFFILIGLPSLAFIRKHFNHPLIDKVESIEVDSNETKAAAYWERKEISLKDIAFSFGIAFAIVAVSNALAGFFGRIIPTSNFFFELLNGLLGNMYLIMTTITMILATTFSDFFNSIHGANELGTFLIYIFFVVIGVPASIPLILKQAPLLLVFTAVIVLVNMLVSLIFGKIFKFNLEEILLASNANIGGPTTAAAMAIAKGWNDLIVPIILAGTLGYVVGNYAGIIMGKLLQLI